MDILTLLHECGPAVHPTTTIALIRAESGGNPYAIDDDTSRRVYLPQSKSQAEKIATRLLQAGHRIDMGLTQISSPWLSAWHVTLSQVFTPCSNIRLGTLLLATNYQRCLAGRTTKTALWCALSRYNTGTSTGGYAYVYRVLSQVHAQAELGHWASPTTPPQLDPYGGLTFPSTASAGVVTR